MKRPMRCDGMLRDAELMQPIKKKLWGETGANDYGVVCRGGEPAGWR